MKKVLWFSAVLFVIALGMGSLSICRDKENWELQI